MSKEKKSRVVEDTPDVNDGVAAPESGAAPESDLDGKIEIQTGVEEPCSGADGTDHADTVAAQRDEINDLKDQLLRKQADFENFRKRMIRDREDAVRYANTNLLLDLVEVIDNFERAILSSEDSRDFDSLHQGIGLIEKQFTGMLDNKYGLKRFECVGEEFDPEKHEAIAAEESAEVEAQMVLDDFQKGYMLHDRVLRHAKVRVAVPATPSESVDEQEDSDQ